MFRGMQGLFIVVIWSATCNANAQTPNQSSDTVWTRLDDTSIEIEDFRLVPNIARPFSAFALDIVKLEKLLRAAPQEFTEQAETKKVVISIPFPDGSFQQFRIEDSPVIGKPLESAGYETHTYKGTGIDDPTATIRCETAYDGFHAIVRSLKGVFYIDPSSKKQEKRPYFSDFWSARPSAPKRLHCEVNGERAKQDRERSIGRCRPAPRPSPLQTFYATPAVLRRYRLALAANSYYNSHQKLWLRGSPGMA